MAEQKAKKSWKTTAAGWAGVGVIALTQFQAWADGDPATVPAWGLVVGAIVVALGMTAARDNKVTSKDAGAE